MYVGDLLCNLMNIENPNSPRNLNYDDPISSTDKQLVSCTIADDQVAGYYNFDGLTIWGYPRELRSTWGMTADG